MPCSRRGKGILLTQMHNPYEVGSEAQAFERINSERPKDFLILDADMWTAMKVVSVKLRYPRRLDISIG